MKKKGNIVSYTLEEIKKLPDKTDWVRLRKMKDKDIDMSDIPLLTEEFWENARLIRPNQKKQAVSVRFDPDILAWLRGQGRGYQTTINAVMRAYMESKLSS